MGLDLGLDFGWVVKMEENTELEEGEACYYKDGDDNIDLDSLSYIDERIQHVLGHFQKDFEGGVSAENLGAKFGGYGSFLPTYERSPFRSHDPDPKTPQRNYITLKSPNNLHVEAASDNSKAPSNVPPSMRLGTASHSSHSLQNLRVLSVDSMKKDIGISSNAVTDRCPLKEDSANKSGNSTDQRTLKFRIKMKLDNLAQKNAAIYTGLGLDNSPSSSMGNSPEESGGMPPVSQETGEESPTGIIQVMTSSPIPGCVLISPLHDSLLYLIRKEKVLGDSRSVSSLNGQEHCSMSNDESDSIVGDGQLLKKRKVRILHMKKRLGNKTPERKDFLSNDMKCTPLSSLICDAGEIAEVTGRASEVSKKVNKDRVKGRMGSTEAVKEESLESISGQDFDKSEKQHLGNGSAQKVLEHKLAYSLKDNSTGPKIDGKCKAYMISKKAECDVIKCKVDQDSKKHEINQKGKPLSNGKNKSKGDQSPSKAVVVAKKDSFGDGNNAEITIQKSAGFGVTCKSKMHKTKSLKDNNVRDGKTDSLKGNKSERIVNGIDPVDGLPGHRAIINANLDNFEGRRYEVKVKERPSGKKMVNKSIAGPGLKDASNACLVTENKPAPLMVQTAVAPQLIEEDWVCCDSCQKWRLLPLGLKPEQLPEKWLCSMLNWLPGMNRCDISEEKTTKALYALYQMPISEGQNNLQSNCIGTAIGQGSTDALQFCLSHKYSSSDVLSDRGKKKPGFKEKKKAGMSTNMLLLFSDSTQKNAQESVKNKSDQHPADVNSMKKTISQHLSNLNSLMEVKHMPKEKDTKMSAGDGEHIKLKRKLEADPYKSGTPKTYKAEDICSAEQLNPGMDLEKVGRNSRNGFPTKASGKDMRKYDEYCLSVEVWDKLVVPVKKQGDRAQVSSDGGSLDVKSNSKKDGSMKKRKLKDRQDNDMHNNMISMQDGKQYGEGSVSEFRKEMKYKVLNAEEKPVIESDEKMNRKGGMSQVCLSSSKNHATVGVDEVGSVDKVYLPRKRSEKIASHNALDGVDPLGRDLGSGQLSLAATSSSSKVSGSHKARTNFEDIKGSPVESVTSSPLRVTNLDKLTLAGGDTSGKDDATKGVLSSMSSRRCSDNGEVKLSVKMKEEKVSYDLPPEFHKFSSIEFQVEDAKDKVRVQAKTSSEVRNDHILSGAGDIVEQSGDCANHEERVNKSNQESALSWRKSGKITSLRGKEKDRRSGIEVDRSKMKVSASENGYSKNCGRYESAVDPSYHASGHVTRNDAKYNSPKFKREIDNISKKNSVRHWSSKIGKQAELKQKDFENSVLKVDAPCSTDRDIVSQQNLIQDFEDGNKADTVCSESRDGKSKVPSSSEGEEKRETLSVGSTTAPGSQKRDISDEHPVHASSNGDVGKLMKSSAENSKGGVNCGSVNCGPDQQLTMSSPGRTNSSQTAFNTMKEATKLKDRADHFKNSGFEFESNETYFEAALKFLHGASLLEIFHKESSKHGNMSQMQIYATAAKLFESCAHEYERHNEMATAALAYKCMEVAYMRVVYCKHSSTNRDRRELQSTLQMVPQGESPSSSASDVDNLNNQAALDKSTLPRGTGTHVAANQVISARNRSNFVQIIDFTQDITYAMEAYRKCQSTFAAANVIMEEAQNRDCITSIRRVIDFSFQDVDELVGLVWIATKAISRANVGGARD